MRVHPPVPEEDDEDDVATVLMDHVHIDDDDLAEIVDELITPQATSRQETASPAVPSPAPLRLPREFIPPPHDHHDLSLDASPPLVSRAGARAPLPPPPRSSTYWVEGILAGCFALAGAAALMMWVLTVA